MSVSFVNATSAASAGSTVASLAPAYASTTAGDLLLIFAVIGGLSTFVDPTGFTAVPTNGSQDVSTTLRGKAWTRKADGTESGSVTVSWTGGNQNGAVIMVALRSQDPTTPLDGSSVTGATASATSRANTSYANAAQTGLEICVYADRNVTATSSWTPPAGFTERVDVCSTATPFISLEWSDQQQPSLNAGSQTVAARTATSAQTGTAYIAWHFDVRNYAGANTELLDYSNAGPAYESVTDPRVWTDLGQDVPSSSAAWPVSGQGWPRIKQG